MDILNTIKKYKMLSPNDNVLVAVSGGADSVALLYGIIALKESLSLNISVAHINHNLRGKDSLKDAQFVKNLCRSLDLQLFSYSVTIDSKGESLEDAARKERYACLCKAAKSGNIQKIALGHNQNDNAETILMRLCRGTGLKGLGGIPPTRNIKSSTAIIIRPLIETPRIAIENFLNKKGLNYQTDITNFDQSFLRNHIRHKLLPILQEITPQAVHQLSKTALLLREEEQLLENLTTTLLQKCTTQNNIHLPTLSQSDIPMQKRIIRSAILKNHNLKNISQIHIDQILALQTNKELNLPGGLVVRRDYDFLSFNQITKINNDESFCLQLPPETPVFIPALSKYAIVSGKFTKTTSADICTKYFNYDKIKGTLEIRTRRQGDRITINGVGTKKLKKEFSDRKIPMALRNTIPLLANGNDILWIIDGDNRTNSAYQPKPGCKLVMVSIKKEFELNHE